MSHNSLMNYYFVNFTLAQHHGWDIDSIENLMPYERDLYADLIKAELDKKEQG